MYPADNGHVKMLYVTATRALYELAVLHRENLTPLIATKAPKEKHMEGFAVEAAEEEDVRKKQTKKEEIEERQVRINEAKEKSKKFLFAEQCMRGEIF